MRKKLAVLLPVLAGICWGIVGLFIRHLDGTGLDNPSIVFTRTAVGSILLFLFIMVTDRGKLRIKLRDLPVVMAISMVGSVLLMQFYNTAALRLSLSLAAVLLSMSPVVVLIASAIIFKEKITLRKVLCMAGAIAGCAMLCGIFDGGGFQWDTLGLLAGIASTICNGVYILLTRVSADKGYSTLTICLYSSLFATIVLAPFTDWQTLGSYMASDVWGSSLFLVMQSVFTSLLPSVAYILGMKYVETSRAAILEGGSEPLTAMATGIIVYSEIPTAAGLAGMVITIIALTLLSCDSDSTRKDKL